MARSTPAWPGRRHQPAGCHWRRCWRAAPRAHACWRCTRGKTAPAPRLQHTRTRAASVRFPLSLPSTWPDGGAPAPDQVLLRSTERRPLLAALRPRTAALSARSSHGARVARAVVTLDGAGSNAAERTRPHTCAASSHPGRLLPHRMGRPPTTTGRTRLGCARGGRARRRRGCSGTTQRRIAGRRCSAARSFWREPAGTAPQAARATR